MLSASIICDFKVGLATQTANNASITRKERPSHWALDIQMVERNGSQN